jgi:hypothetical protein
MLTYVQSTKEETSHRNGVVARRESGIRLGGAVLQSSFLNDGAGEDLKTRPASSYTTTAIPPHLNPTSPRLPPLSTLLYSRLSTHTALAVDEAHPAMLSRFAPRAAAAPRALRFAPVARRNVTTDAASAHVDKSEVPTVRLFQEENEHIGVICATRG